jgi:two-component system sensor histidine kinase KdpD
LSTLAPGAFLARDADAVARASATGPLRPAQALALGIGGVVLVAVVLGPLHASVSRATQALILVVPVVVAAVVGGRRPALLTAVAGTVAYGLVIPPVGSVRIHLGEDLVALIVFLAVALVLGTFVATRIEVLGEVERQRSALLRSVSHDLRTPLAAISAAATELRSDAVHDAATERSLLDLVGDESERLDRLVGNLLSLSRIEADALRPRRQSVDVGELVHESTRRLGRLFSSTPLTVDVPDDLPPVSADYWQLDQVVTNLLENAVRHSPPGTAVHLAARTEGGALLLTVDDEGPGIPPERRDEVFEPFRPGAPAPTSGIGLAICRAIVEAHGGTIAAGDGPGGGARLTVRLPRS